MLHKHPDTLITHIQPPAILIKIKDPTKTAPYGAPKEPYENQPYGTFQNQGYSQLRQELNQRHNRPGHPSGPTYRQLTNSYQQANRTQYSVQQIPPYQGQQQQQQLTYLNVDCKQNTLQYPVKLAKDLDIKPYIQQHDQPAAYYGQQEEHQCNDMYANNKYNTPDNHEQEQHDDNIDANHVEIRPTVNCQICQQPFVVPLCLWQWQVQ